MACGKCGDLSFVRENMFSDVSVAILQSRFISTGRLRFVIDLLKELSSEDFVSKL